MRELITELESNGANYGVTRVFDDRKGGRLGIRIKGATLKQMHLLYLLLEKYGMHNHVEVTTPGFHDGKFNDELHALVLTDNKTQA